MNVRRRLVVSNILMLVIPVAVSLLVYYGGMRVFANVSGLTGRQREGRAFMEAVDAARKMIDEWAVESGDSDFESSMITESKEFIERNADKGIVVLIYKGGKMINEAKLPPDDDILTRVMSDKDASYFGRTVANVRTILGYRVALFESLRVAEMTGAYRDVMFRGTVLSLVCAAIMIILTNKFLTQFVSGYIMRALGAMSGGVRQIRDGNLDFRIDYREDDEFSAVCGDFNQMAVRLRDSEEARNRYEQSRKELIAGISHDLRTPLTSIKAYVEGLEQGVASTSEIRKRYLDTIKKKTNDLEHIIETLFLFSKLDTGEFPYRMERVSLRDIVAEIVAGVSDEYAARGLMVTFAPGGGGAVVEIDPAQTRYAIINIIENSLKYKENETGRLGITVAEETLGADRRAALTMTDDGPGVPEGVTGKLFDLFYRLDGARGDPSRGSGLGLAIVAKIVSHFNGSIRADNVSPHGLSIKITLPLADGESERA